MRTPVAARMSRSSTPAADDHADPGAVEREPHRDADNHGGQENYEPDQRIAQVHRLARGFHRGDQRQLDRTDQPVRCLDLIEVAAAGPQHEIGEHDREADRHHGLAQVLALHAAEDEDLKHDADQRRQDEGDDEGENPGAGRGADGIADIAAEQIERAVREVDVAHQAEDQREAAGDEEIETAERDAVEDRVEEHPLAADRLFKPRRPYREDQPQRHCDSDDDDQCPRGMALDKAGHSFTSSLWRGEVARRPFPAASPAMQALP
ncbi:hypothetical protein ACVWYH_000143 [Bradyrhizobium sp. GM24.11]